MRGAAQHRLPLETNIAAPRGETEDRAQHRSLPAPLARAAPEPADAHRHTPNSLRLPVEGIDGGDVEHQFSRPGWKLRPRVGSAQPACARDHLAQWMTEMSSGAEQNSMSCR